MQVTVDFAIKRLVNSILRCHSVQWDDLLLEEGVASVESGTETECNVAAAKRCAEKSLCANKAKVSPAGRNDK